MMARREASFRSVLGLVVGAGVVAACLCSGGLAEWADGLPDGAVARAASAVAHGVDEGMKAVGVDRVVGVVHGWMGRVRGAG